HAPVRPVVGESRPAGNGAQADHGGGGFSTPPLPTFDFDSPPFGVPVPLVLALGIEVDELFDQPAAIPTITTKLAAIQCLRFIRSPGLVADQRWIEHSAITHAGRIDVRVVLLARRRDPLADS